MTPVFSWTNFRLGVVPEYIASDTRTYKDVVTTISYIRTVVDSDTKLSSQRMGQVYLTLPSANTFTPLANLTQTAVAKFVENSLPLETIDYLLMEELRVIVNNQNLSKVSNTIVNDMVVSPAITIIKY